MGAAAAAEQGETLTESLLAPPELRSKSNASVTLVLVVSALTTASIAFNSGCITGYSSPTQTAIMEELGLSTAQFSLVGSLQTVGLCLGGLLSGKMTDFFGHKLIMWILSFLFILGWLVIALAKNPESIEEQTSFLFFFAIIVAPTVVAIVDVVSPKVVAWMLYLGRLLLGFGSGFQNYVVPAYTVEVSPQNLRGSFAALSPMAVVSGIAFIYVMGSFVSWRALAIIGALVNALRIPFLFFVPDSPRWLAKVGRKEDIASSLQRLRGKEADTSLEATDIREYAESIKRTSKGGFLDLFQRKYASSLIIGIGLLALHDSVGANAYTSYSGVIFVSAGVSSFIGLISQAAVQILSGILTCILIDNFGRRPLLLVSSAGACLGSFLTGLSFILQDYNLWKDGTPVLALISVLLFIGLYVLGLGAIPWILVAEIYPMNIKGAAASIGAVVSHLCSFVVGYYFNFWVNWSAAGTFFIFSAICAVALAFVAALVPETKGKTLEQVQESFSSS